jgi:hypothetical protein
VQHLIIRCSSLVSLCDLVDQQLWFVLRQQIVGDLCALRLRLFDR